AIAPGYPRTIYGTARTARLTASLRRVVGDSWAALMQQLSASEAFSDSQQVVPVMFFCLGVTPKGQEPAQAAPNHSPKFFADEGALNVGVRALSHLAVDYLTK